MNDPSGDPTRTAPIKMAPADGVQIAVYARGRGKPIVMINGLGACAQDWGPLADSLAQHARVITFDNRGAGRSVAPADPFSLERMAQDTAAVFEACGLDSANLIGHSMGGMIAQLIAVTRPDLVERLVLIGTHAGAKSAVPSTPEARAAMFSQEKLPRAELVRRQFMVYVAPHFFEHDRDTFERMVAARLANLIPLEMWQLQLQAIVQSERAESVRAIRAPTLIIHGREDPLVPFANGERLRDLIPGACLVALAECGHMVNWEKSVEAATAISEFLDL